MVNLSGSLGPKDLGTIWSTRWVQDTGRKLSYLHTLSSAVQAQLSNAEWMQPSYPSAGPSAGPAPGVAAT